MKAVAELIRYADASGHEHVGKGVPEGGQFAKSAGELASKLKSKKDKRVDSPVFRADPNKSPTTIVKTPSRDTSPTSEGPLAKASDAESVLKIVNPKNPSAPAATWDNPNPVGYNQAAFMPGVNGEAFTKAVAEAVQAQTASNPYQRLTLPQVYEAAKKAEPNLTYWQFQNGLAKLHKDGIVRAGPFTQAIGTHPKPNELMPLDREFKWYVEPGDGPARYIEDKHPDDLAKSLYAATNR